VTIKKGLAYLLIAIGVAASGTGLYGIVQLFARGITYACVGQGCPYQTPEAVPWIYFATIGMPVGVLSLVGGFLLRKFAGSTTRELGPVGNLAPAGSWAWQGSTPAAMAAGAGETPFSDPIPGTPVAQAIPEMGAGPPPAPTLISSYAPGELGLTTGRWQDALQRGGSVGTSNFQRVTKNIYLGTAIFELLMATGFIIGAIFSDEVRFGFLLTAVILGGVGFGLLYAGGRARRRVQDAARLQQEGVRGEATIVGVEQTGVWLNNNPLVGIDAVVEVPGKAPYRVKKREYVPQVMIGSLSGGGRLPVLVDPRNAGNVLFSWDMG